MKYIKMLGLAVVAAAALMAMVGAGTASAKEGVLCSTATDPCTSKWAVPTTLDFSLTSGTTAKLVDTSNNTLDSCTTSTVHGVLTANPSASGTATGEISKEGLTWGVGGSCTVTTDTIVPGKLVIEAEDNSGNGWVYEDTGSKTEVTVNVFSSCNYGVEGGTRIGTLKEGKPATFIANAVAKKLAGGFLCPETTKWTASYELTAPKETTLYVSHK
jgi:hypothetical protein